MIPNLIISSLNYTGNGTTSTSNHSTLLSENLHKNLN